MIEEWKDIPGYEGKYQVSDCGRIRRLSHYRKNLLTGGMSYFKELTMKPILRGGYYKVLLSNKKSRKDYLIHRVVAIAFLPNPYNKKEVNHKDGNKFNNIPSNLEWVSAKENILHSFLNGLQPIGKRRGRGKYDFSIIKKMRELRMNGQSYGSIAKALGASKSHVSRVCNGKMRAAI